jgi:hypothetical protein
LVNNGGDGFNFSTVSNSPKEKKMDFTILFVGYCNRQEMVNGE